MNGSTTFLQLQKTRKPSRENGLLKLVTKKTGVGLQAEMAEHLCHPKDEAIANLGDNTCNARIVRIFKSDFDDSLLK